MSEAPSHPQTEAQSLRTVSLLVLAAVAGAVALIYTRSLMVPFVLSLLLSYLIRPMVDWLQDRARMPRWAAIVLILLGVLGFFVALVALIASSMAGLGENAELYNRRLISMTEAVTVWLDEQGIELGQAQIVNAVKELPLFDWLKKTAGGVMAFLSNFFLVMIIIIYLVAGRGRPATGQTAALQTKIRAYLITKIVLSVVTGTLVGLILLVLGVDLALVFGLLAFLLNFIPNVGSIVATLLPLPVVLVQFDSPLMISLAIVLPGAVQILVGNLIEPRLLGKSVDLNPIAILLGLMFWGLIWGVVGMLLATPLTAVLKVQLERHAVTRPVARLMGSRALEDERVSTEPDSSSGNPDANATH